MAKENENEDEEFELEIVDDTPPEDRKHVKPKGDDDDAAPFKGGKTASDDGGDDEDDDEAEQYSDRVKKRIKQLTYERHEERRAKEEADRMRAEALRFAETTKAELDKLRKQMRDGEGYLYKEAEGRIEAQMNAVKRELKEAYDTGDSDAIVEAQAKLASLSTEKGRFEGLKRRYNASPQPQANPDSAQAPKQEQPQRRAPSRLAMEWAANNEWFNKDPKMTAYAYGVHEDLIRNKGVQPDTEEYYGQIDKEMRKMFPSNFSGGDPDDGDNPAPVVAAPSRSAPRKPRTVRLTKTQVSLAKRLGLTPEQYAAQLMKEQR